MKEENLSFIKNGSGKQEGGHWKQNSQYTKFLEKRLQDCTEENKRYLLKYADLRNFSYT